MKERMKEMSQWWDQFMREGEEEEDEEGGGSDMNRNSSTLSKVLSLKSFFL